MKRPWIWGVAIGVPVAAVLFFAGYFSHKFITKPIDTRQPVVLNKVHHAAVISAMRGNLQWYKSLLESIEAGNRRETASIARTAMRSGPARYARHIRRELPEDWRRMGQLLDEDLMAVSDAAEKKEPQHVLWQRAAKVLSSCIACHETFRLAHSGWPN